MSMKSRQDSISDLDTKLANQIEDIMAKPESIFISVTNEDDDDDPGMVITEHEMTSHHDELGDIVHTEQITMDEHELHGVEEYDLNPAPSFQNIVVQHMDIAEPLTVLRKLLETKLQCSLKNHEFYLQDQILLDPDRNLVEQCVQGEGMVQINAEIKSQPGTKPKINIVDILKQTEEIIESPAPAAPAASSQTKVSQTTEDTENVTRWIVDQNFRKEQDRLKIPYDPVYWNESHVMHWIEWAMNEFQLENVDLSAFSEMTGEELVELRHEQFQKLIPSDKGDLFWTHLELLRKCRFVAVVQQPTPQAVTTVTVSTSNSNVHGGSKGFMGKPWKPKKMATNSRILGVADDRAMPGNRSGNNGQIQLWQFLLELLTDKECREVIFWQGDDGEFKLNHPEMVAQMWGQRKNKPNMTYEKLSRALRYYYDGDMIAKVHGKRFTYKFVCDLKMLLGYSAAELNRLTTDCAEKQLRRVRETFRPIRPLVSQVVTM